MHDAKKSLTIRHLGPSGHHHTTLLGYIFATKAHISNWKKTWWTYSRPTSGWDLLASLGHSSKFQWISSLGSVTAWHSSSGCQPNFVALNRGRHLCSAGRTSRWALAHILVIIAFRVSSRPWEMYCSHSRFLSVCLSLWLSVRGRMPTLLHGPGLTWRSGRGCLLVVHCWADLQSVHGCVAMATLWKCMAEPTACSATHYACQRRLPSPAIKLTCLLRAPFHFVHTAGCCNANAKC